VFELDLNLRAGTRLGRFKILRSLGKGGMGAVYYATDTLLGTNVALKILSPELATSEGFERFRREALLARQVTHAGICRIFDLHEEEGNYFISMEYVAGPTLLKVLRDTGLLPPDLAVGLVRQICTAVAVAHGADIVHRDLKPANIIVRGQKRVSILDFGLSTGANMARITQAGTAMGTLHYMPPEIVHGEIASKQSDIYSTGVILYQCVTGLLPFAGTNYVEMQQAIVSGHMVLPRQANPGLSADLQQVIQTAMAVEPAQRYASMEAFEAALAQVHEQGRLQSGAALPPLNPKLADYFPSVEIPQAAAAMPAPTPVSDSVQFASEQPTEGVASAPAPLRNGPPTRTLGSNPDTLAPDLATEAVSASPETLSFLNPPSEPLAADFATEAVISQPVMAGEPPRTGKRPLLLVGGLVVLVLAALFAFDRITAGQDGLRGGAAAVDAGGADLDAAGALVMAGLPDAAEVTVNDAATAALDTATATAAEPDVGATAKAGKDRKGGRRPWKPKPDRGPTPPLPGDKGVHKASAQKLARDLMDKVTAARSQKGLRVGDSTDLDRALNAMHAAKSRRDYGAVKRAAERALEEINAVRVNRDFVKEKLQAFNTKADKLGKGDTPWFKKHSVKIHTVMNNGDYTRASRLLSEGFVQLNR